MIVSSGPASLSARSLAVLRSVGAWMTIAPEQTYVATSIRGLGACKSTYCRPERRELQVRAAVPSGRLAALLAVAVAASGLLSGFAAHRQAEARDMAEPDQLGPGIADCQKSAASVSSGASAAETAGATLSCGSTPAIAAAGTGRAVSGQDTGFAGAADAISRAAAAARVGFAGG
ncbi:MAG TPA: hypothetical protein VFL30_11430 [Rhodanobacteraceae bacterium]|nr:hypothetical protein [Rhodanobacteraceae bacterium]